MPKMPHIIWRNPTSLPWAAPGWRRRRRSPPAISPESPRSPARPRRCEAEGGSRADTGRAAAADRAPQAQTVRLVDRRHSGGDGDGGDHRLFPRRPRPLFRNPLARSPSFLRCAAESDRRLSHRRLCRAPAAARSGHALDRDGVGIPRTAHRRAAWHFSPRRPGDDLSGGVGLRRGRRRCRRHRRLCHGLDHARLYARAGVGNPFLRSGIRRLAHSAVLPLADTRRTPGAPYYPPHAALGAEAMMLFFVEGLLWVIVAALALAAAVRGRILFREGLREGVMDFLRLLPKVLIGVVGSGYMAAVMPPDIIARWLGPESGFFGVVVAVIGGALSPGGPVVGFSISAAALKSGAGAPQVLAYMTAWALFAVQRFILWELPIMPRGLVWTRVIASLPLPFLLAAAAMLVGKP